MLQTANGAMGRRQGHAGRGHQRRGLLVTVQGAGDEVGAGHTRHPMHPGKDDLASVPQPQGLSVPDGHVCDDAVPSVPVPQLGSDGAEEVRERLTGRRQLLQAVASRVAKGQDVHKDVRAVDGLTRQRMHAESAKHGGGQLQHASSRALVPQAGHGQPQRLQPSDGICCRHDAGARSAEAQQLHTGSRGDALAG